MLYLNVLHQIRLVSEVFPTLEADIISLLDYPVLVSAFSAFALSFFEVPAWFE